MDKVYILFSVLVFITVIAGLFRVFLGPTRADRMLAAQLSGTAIVTIFLLLAMATGKMYLIDMALVFALLTSVSSIIFVKLTWQRPMQSKDP